MINKTIKYKKHEKMKLLKIKQGKIKTERKRKKVYRQNGGEINSIMSLKIFASNGFQTLKNISTNFSDNIKNKFTGYTNKLNDLKQSTNNSIFNNISNLKNSFSKRINCLTS